ncbi:7-cyano-7-deazaguanine synthase [Pigmentiphaga soli]|uniref:7-cyano-7-deazaguanine synthase n=1 Tax=Pigmentiphaga soli TaxID=1007095 RepID=UPI003CD061E9
MVARREGSSCYRGRRKHCGYCKACHIRAPGFSRRQGAACRRELSWRPCPARSQCCAGPARTPQEAARPISAISR